MSDYSCLCGVDVFMYMYGNTITGAQQQFSLISDNILALQIAVITAVCVCVKWQLRIECCCWRQGSTVYSHS